jgi:superfamily II DNA or RNA helicase
MGADQPSRRRRSRKRPPKGNANQPLPLHKRAASHFQQGDRQRGANYFQQGRVELQLADDHLLARIEGNDQQIYLAGLDWSRVPEDRALHAYCQCPRFAGGEACKHLWATLLALSDGSPDIQPAGRDRVSLRKDRGGTWSERGIPAVSHASGAPVPKRKRRGRKGRGKAAQADGPPTTWRSLIAAVRAATVRLAEEPAKGPTRGRAPITYQFLINAAASLDVEGLVIDIFGRGQNRSGRPARLKRVRLDSAGLQAKLTATVEGDPSEDGVASVSDEDLSVITSLPLEPQQRRGRGRGGRNKPMRAEIQRFLLPPPLIEPVLERLSAQGILGWWNGRSVGDPKPLTWDQGPIWSLVLRLDDAPGGRMRLSGELEREKETIPLSVPELILPAGGILADQDGMALMLLDDTIARLELSRERDLPWLGLLREIDEMVIPKEEISDALVAMLELSSRPRLDSPNDLQISEESAAAQPRLVLKPDPAATWTDSPLLAELSFEYGALEVSAEDPRPAVANWEERKFLRRDMDAEHAALVRLLELGLQPIESAQGHLLELAHERLAAVAEPLLAEGWSVEARGASMRPPSGPALKVESNIDWFELSGEVDFDGDQVNLSDILAAISKGDRFIELADGSKGLLPESWMETYDSLAKLSHDATDEGLRFLPSQALLVDALLATMPAPDVDKAFAELRDKLQAFDRIKPKKELKTFEGELRTYQREGLGWLLFLRDFGLGGVLADDMGLGKTVQVLALLQTVRTPAKTTKLPSLVVAPRSLVYNWLDEARRFTPKLKMVEYSGPGREALQDKLDKYDAVVTTYGTLRRDVGFLATVEFDTIILDEAQAIKNPTSQTAKASRALRARNRLALTGTPIENHLGELGSIFEFLNPGLLGRLPWLDVLSRGQAPSASELALVSKGIRPFILRRTKTEVLPDLPPKTEQVLHCTLHPRQREIYDQLRAQYQTSLREQVESKGVAGSAIQVLQALLRLRQVACHPGLVDESFEDAGSAKLDTLFEQVSEVLDEGHKVLVFSQFTKLLGYVRERLEEKDLPYAYLDGQTRNRGEIVEHFQTDPECNLFLVSLKAGGVGLNLTAAGYVFLLDPWWNPAVEAQAIDRTHRIGQTMPVFAYRMIAEDTVEEKILDLQQSKREIAEAILDGGEGTQLRDLTAEDLDMLLS